MKKNFIENIPKDVLEASDIKELNKFTNSLFS